MSETRYFDFYMNYIKEFNIDIVCCLDEGEISHYEAEFPSDVEEMTNFIKAFERIFPEAHHNLNRYINLLRGLKIMEQTDGFRDTEIYLDIIDDIRENALEELQDQISNYPQKVSNQTNHFDFHGYIKELNENLHFDGGNSYIIQEGSGESENYSIMIEGNHYTTLEINISHQELEKQLKNNNLELFILRHYEAAIDDMCVDELFDELYSSITEYRASEFLNMLLEDKKFFTEVIKEKIEQFNK